MASGAQDNERDKKGRIPKGKAKGQQRGAGRVEARIMLPIARRDQVREYERWRSTCQG